MTSSADAWLATARARLSATHLGARAESIGRVEEVGDGIARIYGLSGLMSGYKSPDSDSLRSMTDWR